MNINEFVEWFNGSCVPPKEGIEYVCPENPASIWYRSPGGSPIDEWLKPAHKFLRERGLVEEGGIRPRFLRTRITGPDKAGITALEGLIIAGKRSGVKLTPEDLEAMVRQYFPKAV